MHDNGWALFQMCQELLSRPFLIAAAKGEDNPPVAALKITALAAAVFGFQQAFLGVAERAQIGITWDDDFVACGRRVSGVTRNDPPNQPAVSGFIGKGLVRVKIGITKKLLGQARQGEAMLGVSGPGLPPMGGPVAVGVVLIDPD